MTSAFKDFDGIALPPKNGEPDRIVWLMHGSGGRAHDMTKALGDAIRRKFAQAAIYAPEGRIEARNGNRQHFELERHYSPRLFSHPASELTLCEMFSRQAIRQNAASCGRQINTMLSAVQQHHGLGDGDTVMMGYSQGGQCVLEAALARREPVRQVISIFGNWLADMNVRARPPVIMVSSMEDRVMPCQAMRNTLKALQAQKVPVDFKEVASGDHHRDWSRLALQVVPRLA